MLLYSKVLEISEFAFKSTSPSSCLPLFSLSPPAKRHCCRRSGPAPGHLLLALASTRRAGPLHRFYPSRWPSFPLATPPRRHRRPPPCRRRGPAKTEPQSSISRTQQHYKNPPQPVPLILSPFPQSQTPLDGVLACTLGGLGDTWRSRTPRGGRCRTLATSDGRPSSRGSWRHRAPSQAGGGPGAIRVMRWNPDGRSWQNSDGSRSHSAPQCSGWRSSDRSWRTGLRSQPL